MFQEKEMDDKGMIKPTDAKLFEEMVRDCAVELYPGVYDLFGRNGQSQYGCDIFSTDFKTIIQCKCYNENKKNAYQIFMNEIIEDFREANVHFDNMERFIAVTTLDRDGKTQETLYNLDKDRVKIVFWEDFEKAYSAYNEKYRPKEVREALREALLYDRDVHPSFQLMKADEIDKHIFAGFEDTAPSHSFAVENQDYPVSPIWDFIKKTRMNGSCRSIVIEGKGGIGKTVALFSLAADDDAHSVPAIYIPMYRLKVTNENCVYQYIKQKFPYLHKEIEALAKTPRSDGPGITLLLDGFNEVSSDQLREILEHINNWKSAHKGAQLIAVSRPLDALNLKDELAGAPLYIELQPLAKETAQSFIKKYKLEPPAPNAPVWDILTYPLFLVLYVKTGILNGRYNAGYALAPKDSNNGGSVIWNYLQRELLKIPNSEEWFFKCAVVCEWVLPYLAYHMEQLSCFTLDLNDANKLIDEAIGELQICAPEQLPDHLKSIYNTYCWKHTEYPNLASYSNTEWRKLALRDCGVLVGSATSGTKGFFSFLHQNFRDCLSGLHLVNWAERIQQNEMPTVWRSSIKHYVLSYASELMNRPTAERLWEANRLLRPTDKTATYTQLELQLKLEPSKRINLDFSNMDLRGLSITRYCSRNGNSLPIFQNAALSKNTRLDEETFQSVGHAKRITCVSALWNGLCISGSDDKTLKIWDVNTGECFQTIENYTNCINFVAIFPDGHCVSEARNHILHVWNITTGDILHTFREHSWFIACVAVLPDGRYVSGSEHENLRVWDKETGNCVQILKGHTDWVRCVVSLPNGKCVSGSDDQTLRVWDTNTGECLHVLNGHEARVTCIAALQDGRCISGAFDGNLRVWDTYSGVCLKSFNGNNREVTCIAVLPDERCISGSVDGSLQLWNINTGKCLMTLRGHAGSITCVTVLRDGRCVSGSDDTTLRLWDTETGKCLRCIGRRPITPIGLTVMQNGRHISLSADGTMRLWNTESGTLQKTLPRYPGTLNFIATLPNGYCVSGAWNGTLRIWNVDTGKCLKTLHGSKGVNCIAVLPNGNYVSGLRNNTLRVRSTDEGKRLQALQGHTKAITCIDLLPNGLCISGSDDHTLRIWNVETGECLQTLRGHTRRITCVVALSNTHCISTVDENLWVWDLSTGKRQKILRGHTSPITCIASLSDNRCVSGSYDKTLRIWDVEAGKCLRTLTGHTECVNCVLALPNGKILSGAADNTLRIWDPNVEECLGVSELIEPDVCGMDISLANLAPNLAHKLWINGIKIPENNK